VKGFSPRHLFSRLPVIYFHPEIDSSCDTFTVLKTSRKKLITLDIGAFETRETHLKSRKDGIVYTSQELRGLAPHRCTFGYDIIVYVGYALFVRCRGEREIIEALAERNVRISDREIAFLGKKFLTYLGVAHQESRHRIRSAMERRGGYILHLDGTCEGDSPHLFTGLDGIAELVLENVKLPSERSELLVPFFDKIKRHYGDPIALVHDMGKGILSAVNTVFPGIPDYICHFHFLRDIGKDLLDSEYSKIRNSLKKHKIRGSLRQIAKHLEKTAGKDHEVFKALHAGLTSGGLTAVPGKSPAICVFASIHWAFDISAELNGYGFPFDRPHLLFYHRLSSIYEAIESIRKTPLSYESEYRPMNRLFRVLKPVMEDVALKKNVKQIDRKVKVYEDLREALRIALPEGKNGLNDHGDDTDMGSIRSRVTEFRNKLLSDDNYSTDYDKMIHQLDTYWEKLFADPIEVNTPQGIVFFEPQRTNNILERFFRDFKRRNRKRSGSVSLSKTLKAILSSTPLVKNLENTEYLDIILNGANTLEERFAQIDANIVTNQLKEANKENRKLPIQLKKLIREPLFPQNLAALLGARQN